MSVRTTYIHTYIHKISKKKILTYSSVQHFHIRIWLDIISFSHLSLHLQLHILLSRCWLEVYPKFNGSEQPPPALRFNLSQKATLTETQTLSHIHRHLSGDVSDKHSTVNQRCTFSPWLPSGRREKKVSQTWHAVSKTKGEKNEERKGGLINYRDLEKTLRENRKSPSEVCKSKVPKRLGKKPTCTFQKNGSSTPVEQRCHLSVWREKKEEEKEEKKSFFNMLTF